MKSSLLILAILVTFSAGNAGTITSTPEGGLWSSTTTWEGGDIPVPGDDVVIEGDVTVDCSVTIHSVTINGGHSLICRGAEINSGYEECTITIEAGGSFINNSGAFTYPGYNSTVIFAGSGTITGPITFYNLTLTGSVSFSEGVGIEWSCRLLSATAHILVNSPQFIDQSTLYYDGKGSCSPGLEWVMDDVVETTGKPCDVELVNSSALALDGGYSRTAKSLTIGTGCSLALSPTTDGNLVLTGGMMMNGTAAIDTKQRVIEFRGTSGSIQPSAGAVFYDILYATGFGGWLMADLHISHSLTMQSGALGMSEPASSTTVYLDNGATLTEWDGYVEGYVKTTKVVGKNSVSNWAGLGVDISAGVDDVGTVTLTRITGDNGLQTAYGSSGIKASWIFDVQNPVPTGRALTLRWKSQYNYMKDLTKARLWGKPALPPIWLDISQSNQDASTTQAITAAYAYAGSGIGIFTVTDDTHPLYLPEFAGGDGTEGDPYQITTPAQLSNARDHLAGHFIVNNDINLNTSTLNTDADGWEPIGTNAAAFTGTFNGNGKTISNLKIIKSGAVKMGLFGQTSGAAISSVILTNVDVTGNEYVGALVGSSTASTTITGCSSAGSVTGSATTGGLVGSNHGSTITKSSSSCIVSSSDPEYGQAFGGLIGDNSPAGVVSECFATGAVSGVQYVGGLIGTVQTASVTDCYARGVVDGDYTGGLIGMIVSGSMVSHCYATGSQFGTNVGGFLGWNNGNAVVDCFWDTETAGTETDASATGKTTSEMTVPSTFAAWDVALWNRDDLVNDGYPYLKWQNPGGAALPVDLVSFTATANGRGVVLSWKTATETNNYGFEIERRSSAPSQVTGVQSGGAVDAVWKKIGFVEGAGTTSAPKTYTFSDTKIPAGSSAYRLKQIDRDGKYCYSSAIELSGIDVPAVFRLVQNFPNPFNPSTTISFTVPSTGHATLNVFNTLGQKVATLFNGEARVGMYHQVQFDASGLASGIYFSRLEYNGNMQMKKMTLLR